MSTEDKIGCLYREIHRLETVVKQKNEQLIALYDLLISEDENKSKYYRTKIADMEQERNCFIGKVKLLRKEQNGNL